MSKQKKDENMEQEKNKKEMEKMTDEKIEQYAFSRERVWHCQWPAAVPS